MLENYIDQIITMGTLADSVTIIDDQQIIRHFQPFNPDIVPFTASDVVGTHFRSTFLDVDPADSGVLRALHGESTISRAYTHLLFNGQRSSGIESIFPMVDILFVSEETSRRMLKRTGTLSEIQKSYADDYGCRVVATTQREVVSPTRHNFGSVIYSDGEYYTEAPYMNIDVVDRVGSGDAYVAGVLYGILTSGDIKSALSYGNALSAVKDTVYGDMSVSSIDEIKNVIAAHNSTGPQDEMVR